MVTRLLTFEGLKMESGNGSKSALGAAIIVDGVDGSGSFQITGCTFNTLWGNIVVANMQEMIVYISSFIDCQSPLQVHSVAYVLISDCTFLRGGGPEYYLSFSNAALGVIIQNTILLDTVSCPLVINMTQCDNYINLTSSAFITSSAEVGTIFLSLDNNNILNVFNFLFVAMVM
jgi:hypothetical protein